MAQRTRLVALLDADDRALAAIAGRDQSFVVLYELLFPRLVDFAERFLGRDGAQDAVHEAISDIWSRWPQLASGKPSVAFFFRAVRNQIALARRREHRHEERLTQFVSSLDARHSVRWPGMELERRELATIIRTTVAAMPRRCREVWALVRENELTYGQAAESLELSLSTVKGHMTRANALLREALVDAGYHDPAETKPIRMRGGRSAPGTGALPDRERLRLGRVLPTRDARGFRHKHADPLSRRPDLAGARPQAGPLNGRKVDVVIVAPSGAIVPPFDFAREPV